MLTGVAYTTWLERKLIGRIQNRWGPTRVGPFGLLQPLADGVKFILKEDLLPDYVHKGLFILAPMLALVMSLISIAVIPFGETITIAGHTTALQISGITHSGGGISDINIGLLIILGVTSIGVYGVALAGWSSNSKYSLLGSLRASAQMISYELALGLSLVGILLLAGTLSLRGIVDSQIQGGRWFGFLPHWYIFPQFIAFFIYLMAAFAETNRIPFDLPEAETELVAGYHTEYSAINLLAQRHPINSALSLVVVMSSLALIYLLLGAEFVAAIQIIVYAGAIMVLFVFVIMLLNAGAEERTQGSRIALLIGVPGVIVLASTIGWILIKNNRQLGGITIGSSNFGATSRIANLLVKDFLLPFEITSVLI